MSLNVLIENREIIVAFMAALSVFSAFLVVSWPYLIPNNPDSRMRQMTRERERIRARERARMKADKQHASLRTEPRKLFKDIVDRFNLAKQAEDGEMARRLRMAGYRGHGPVVTFLAVRVMAPLAMFAVASLYVFFVLKLHYPFFVKLALASGIGCLGYYAPALYVRNRIAKRQKAIRRAWPDMLDLLLICVESGMGIESAFHKVSEEIGSQSIELAEEMSLTTAELSYLQDRRRAYVNLGERTGLNNVKAVVMSLIQAEEHGTPIGQALRVLAQENRDTRMSEAEKKAAALPPKLTVPMILFFLPVLFAVICTPAAIQIANLH
jgi:tight adherence protein C